MATLERLKVSYDLYIDHSLLHACLFSSKTGNDTFNDAKLNEISGQIEIPRQRSLIFLLKSMSKCLKYLISGGV